MLQDHWLETNLELILLFFVVFFFCSLHPQRQARPPPRHEAPACRVLSIHPSHLPLILPLGAFPGSWSAIFPVRRKLQWWVWQRGGAAMLGSRICCDWRRGGLNKREIHRGQLILFLDIFDQAGFERMFILLFFLFVCLFLFFGTTTCTALCCKVLARP